MIESFFRRRPPGFCNVALVGGHLRRLDLRLAQAVEIGKENRRPLLNNSAFGKTAMLT
jgi:hypothetical protein